MVLESLFGETLKKNDGTDVKTSELSTSKGGVIGIYFSALWSPPCRKIFTPKLVSVYNQIKEAGKIYCSLQCSMKMIRKFYPDPPTSLFHNAKTFCCGISFLYSDFIYYAISCISSNTLKREVCQEVCCVCTLKGAGVTF